MEVAKARPEWAIGFEDECWWSRLALPTLSSWAEEGKPMRLIQQSVAKEDPDPKAISCYGLYLPELDQTWLRFVVWQARELYNDPISPMELREARSSRQESVGSHLGQRKLWHISKEVRRWLGKHNRRVKQSGCGVRIVSCLLPKRSPWLNAIEAQVGPRQTQGRRAGQSVGSVRACREGLPGL